MFRRRVHRKKYQCRYAQRRKYAQSDLHDAQLDVRLAETLIRNLLPLPRVLAARAEILLPRVNEDLPTFYALQFQNAVLEPRVVLQFLSHFIFIFSVED